MMYATRAICFEYRTHQPDTSRRNVAHGVRIRIIAAPRLSFFFRPQPTHHANSTLRSGVPRGAAFDVPAAVYEEWSAPPRGVTVFAIRATKTAHPSRKNGAATPRPPVHVGSRVSSRSFHRPCAVTSVAAGVCPVRARPVRATAAPAPLGTLVNA